METFHSLPETTVRSLYHRQRSTRPNCYAGIHCPLQDSDLAPANFLFSVHDFYPPISSVFNFVQFSLLLPSWPLSGPILPFLHALSSYYCFSICILLDLFYLNSASIFSFISFSLYSFVPIFILHIVFLVYFRLSCSPTLHQNCWCSPSPKGCLDLHTPAVILPSPTGLARPIPHPTYPTYNATFLCMVYQSC